MCIFIISSTSNEDPTLSAMQSIFDVETLRNIVAMKAIISHDGCLVVFNFLCQFDVHPKTTVCVCISMKIQIHPLHRVFNKRSCISFESNTVCCIVSSPAVDLIHMLCKFLLFMVRQMIQYKCGFR